MKRNLSPLAFALTIAFGVVSLAGVRSPQSECDACSISTATDLTATDVTATDVTATSIDLVTVNTATDLTATSTDRVAAAADVCNPCR